MEGSRELRAARSGPPSGPAVESAGTGRRTGAPDESADGRSVGRDGPAVRADHHRRRRSGIYQLYRMVELGVHATVLEASGDLGGTWYRNRYPGCRFDSESYTYGYSFSKELLQEWDWKDLRLALWERLYGEPGFGIWLQNFREIFTDEEANAEFSEYIAGIWWTSRSRRSSASRRRGSARRRLTSTSTSSCTPPASTRSPVPSTRTTEGLVLS